MDAINSLILAAAQVAATGAPCAAEPHLHALDFWLGEWAVFEQDQKVGSNSIRSILGGCAIVESWRDVEGNEGRSLFFPLPGESRWKQVWVTDHARTVGGTKEKLEDVAYTKAGRVRFEGSYPGHASGERIQDRTTLTQEPDGSVRQVIEVSRDGGATWRATFDAIYRKLSAPG